jgi:hypothetical protein
MVCEAAGVGTCGRSGDLVFMQEFEQAWRNIVRFDAICVLRAVPVITHPFTAICTVQ